ncbi:MAG: substrate-binding domain-containing protein [Defluviitaleaceae bacterium]|nr:substrate-binding domain-containing protein [Defluviitaleaceae bacterium]
MKKLLAAIVLAIILIATLAACGRDTAPAQPTPAQPAPAQPTPAQPTPAQPAPAQPAQRDNLEGMTMGAFVVIEDQFQRALQQSMARTFESFGANVITANAASQLDIEVVNIHNALAAGLDGLAIFPVDPVGSATALQEAANQGVKIFGVNVNLGDDLQVGWAQSDQYGKGVEVGAYAREWLLANFSADQFPLRMAVMEFLGLNTVMSNNRTDGFLSQVYDLVDIIVRLDDWMADTAFGTASDALVAFPDIDVWWWANEGAAVGSVNAQRAAGVTIPGFTIAMSEQIAEMILANDGNLIGANGQNPDLLGQVVATNLAYAIMGRPHQTFIETGGIMLVASDQAGAQAWLTAQRS